jgi:hypothetical protein
MEVIQDNRPSSATLRQQALDQAMQNVLGGIGAMQAQSAQQEATKRQEALRQEEMGMEAASKGLERYVTNQDKIDAATQAEASRAPSFTEKIFGKKSDLPQAEYGYRYTKEKQDAMQAEKEKARLENEMKRRELGIKEGHLALEREKAAAESGSIKDPVKRLAKSNAEVKGKVGGIASALDALSEMEVAVKGGEGPQLITARTPILGRAVSDTKFTQNQNVLNEVVGRLQSGGAITSDELDSFERMGPRWGDSPEIQRSKMAQQRAFLTNKLAAFGFQEEELPKLGLAGQSKYQKGTMSDVQAVALSPIKSKGGVGFNPSAKPSGPISAAVAAPKPQHMDKVKTMSDEELKAYLSK